jgi:beta-phosphoglucomutase-like phosphatase (HAD superfamily)
MMSSPAKPDLIIFDCDGVLVDSEVLSCECLSELLGECGIALSEDEVVELFLGRSTAALLSHYKDDRRFVPEIFLPELKSRVLQRFGAQLRPIPGITAVLFEGRLYTAQMVSRGKPAPDLFLYAAEQMGAAPQRTLVIEDSVSGVAAAKAAGMVAWGFVGGSHYRSRDGRAMLYDAGADRVFDRMADFWRKD